MQTVLVPLDGSELAERALRPAVSMARRAGAAVHLLTVGADAPSGELRSYLEEQAATTDLPAVVHTVRGDPAEVIVHTARTAPDPLICMASRGGGGLSRFLTGSTTDRVLAESACPVVLVGPRAEATLPEEERGRLVVCVDPTPDSESVLEPAAQLARSLDMDVWLVEVAPYGDAAPAGEGGSATVRRRLEDLAGELVARGAPPPAIEVVAATDVPSALAGFAGRIMASQMAMASHVRRGLRRLAGGSVTLDTVAEAPCPVLVVRSAGES